MKIRILVAAIACLVLANISALHAQGAIGIGIKGGLNIASASYDPDIPAGITKSSRTALMVGAQLEFRLAAPLYLQFEPMYVQKGTKIEGPVFGDELGNAINGSFTTKLGFIEIPMLLKGKFLTGPVLPYVFFGPSLGIRLSASETDEAAGFPSQDLDIKDQTNSIDFGLVFGAGAEFALAPTVGITVDGRYALGLTDLSKEQPDQIQHRKIKTKGIQLLAGVLFHI